MNVIFKLNVKDYIEFTYWYNIKWLLIASMVYIASISYLIYPVIINKHHGTALILDLVTAIVFIIIGVSLNFELYFRAKKIFASDTFLKMEHNYNITSESISVTTERSSAIIKWDDVYTFAESKDSFYIFIAGNKAHLLPKRFLGDAATQELRQLATSNLPAKKVKLRK